MHPAVEKFKEVLAYESRRNDKPMIFEGYVTRNLSKLAKQVVKKNKLELKDGHYSYEQCNGDVFTIDVEQKTCSCDRFLDKAACKHLTAACIKENVALDGLKLKTNTILTRKRKKARKIDSDEDVSDANEDEPLNDKAIEEPSLIEPIEIETPIEAMEIETPILGNIINVEKPKRGRPTNAERALRLDKEQLPQKKTKKVTKPVPDTGRILRSQKQ